MSKPDKTTDETFIFKVDRLTRVSVIKRDGKIYIVMLTTPSNLLDTNMIELAATLTEVHAFIKEQENK